MDTFEAALPELNSSADQHQHALTRHYAAGASSSRRKYVSQWESDDMALCHVKK